MASWDVVAAGWIGDRFICMCSAVVFVCHAVWGCCPCPFIIGVWFVWLCTVIAESCAVEILVGVDWSIVHCCVCVIPCLLLGNGVIGDMSSGMVLCVSSISVFTVIVGVLGSKIRWWPPITGAKLASPLLSFSGVNGGGRIHCSLSPHSLSSERIGAEIAHIGFLVGAVLFGLS